MDLETFKHWQMRKPFYFRLRWFMWTTEKIKDLSNDIFSRRGDPHSVEWYVLEKQHQIERQEFLYYNLLESYEHMKTERDRYKKLAMKRRRR